MFNFLAPVLILGIITLGTYRIFELFVRRKERMQIIEKMHSCVDRLDLSFLSKSHNSSWALRASLLMIGLGIGFIVGFLLQLSLGYQIANMNMYLEYSRDSMEIIYLASIILFGGIGLLTAYFIERKEEKKKA